MATEIQLKINADVKAAKQSIQDIKAETQSAVDGVGAFGVTWGSVKGQFHRFKLIAVNGLKMIKAQSLLAGNGVKMMFGGKMRTGAKVFFNVVKTGIASTGIGLLILAFASLISYFSAGEKGAAAFGKITSAIGVIIGNVTDILGNYGEMLYNIATMDFTAAKDSFDKMAAGVTDFYSETKRELIANNELQDKALALQRFERQAIVDKAEAQKEMMRLRLAARDEENFSTKERIKFMQEATKIAEVQLEKDLHVAREKLRIKSEENSLNVSSSEDLDEEAQLKAAVFQVETANYSERKRMAMEEIALKNQARAQDKAIRDKKNADDKVIQDAADKKKADDDKLLADKIKKDQDSADILRNMRLDNTLLEIEDAVEKARAEIEIQRTKELESLESHTNYLELKAEVDKKYDDKLKNVKAAEVTVIETTEQMKLATASKGLAAVQSLAGEHKALAVAQATIDGYGSVVGALNDKSTPSATLRFINAAAMGVMAIANIKKIVSVKAGNGGGGGGNLTPANGSSSPAPQFSSGQFELKGGGTQQPVEAYVVTDSMTNSQDRLSSIRRRATI